MLCLGLGDENYILIEIDTSTTSEKPSQTPQPTNQSILTIVPTILNVIDSNVENEETPLT